MLAPKNIRRLAFHPRSYVWCSFFPLRRARRSASSNSHDSIVVMFLSMRLNWNVNKKKTPRRTRSSRKIATATIAMLPIVSVNSAVSDGSISTMRHMLTTAQYVRPTTT
eukprot:Amastigsp_a833_266.p4 type:complete len:109 gc:universal Amastigsp_a833_266:196-522(+)